MKFRILPSILVVLLIGASTALAKPPKAPAEKVELKKDLELWLPLQNGFRDYSKNHHVGEVNGNLRIESDGARFDGEGDHIIFPNLPLSESSFAISMWIRVSGNFGNYGILQQKNSGQKHEWLHLMLRDRMNPFFSFYVANAMGESRFGKLDGWQHLLVQYDEKKSRAEIYVDGRLEVSKKQPPFRGEGGKFIIGLTPKWSNVPAKDFEGSLSEFRVYTRVLNKKEVSYLASMHSRGGK